MKIILEFKEHDRYLLAKSELEDPEMKLWDTTLLIRYNDFGDEIIIEEFDIKEIIRIESCIRYFGIYFSNGNCLELFTEEAAMDIRF